MWGIRMIRSGIILYGLAPQVEEDIEYVDKINNIYTNKNCGSTVSLTLKLENDAHDPVTLTMLSVSDHTALEMLSVNRPPSWISIFEDHIDVDPEDTITEYDEENLPDTSMDAALYAGLIFAEIIGNHNNKKPCRPNAGDLDTLLRNNNQDFRNNNIPIHKVLNNNNMDAMALALMFTKYSLGCSANLYDVLSLFKSSEQRTVRNAYIDAILNGELV